MTSFFRKWVVCQRLRHYDMHGSRIQMGDLLRVYSWPADMPPVSNSFLWRVEKVHAWRRVLVAPTTGQRVPLSMTRAELLIRVPEPAGFSLTDYPDQLRSWAAAGWGVYLTSQTNGKGAVAFATQQHRVASLPISGQELTRWRREPAAGGVFLDATLFSLLHPVRAKRMAAAGITEIPAAELTAMRRRLQRLAGK